MYVILSIVYPIIVKSLSFTESVDLKGTLVSVRNESSTIGFDLNNHSYTNNDAMSSATTVAPYIREDGSLDCGVNTNMHQNLPKSTEWNMIIKCDMGLSGSSAIAYNNTTDGSITLRGDNGVFKLYPSDTTFQEADSVGSFTDSSKTTNTLYVARKDNTITFQYVDTNNEWVKYTKEYDTLGYNGTLYIRVANGSCILRQMLFTQWMDKTNNATNLPIYEENNWTFTSRGTGSTTPVINDDGTLQLGRYTIHIHNYELDKTKQYDVYFYDPNPIENMYMGVGGGGLNPSTKAAIQSNGVIEGINKATIYNNNGYWHISYNDNTPLQLSNRNTAQVTILTREYASSSNNRILAITEKEDGGN